MSSDAVSDLYDSGLDALVQASLSRHPGVSSIMDACRDILRVVGGLSSGAEELVALEESIDIVEEGQGSQGTRCCFVLFCLCWLTLQSIDGLMD